LQVERFDLELDAGFVEYGRFYFHGFSYKNSNELH
jgi:hypothetical protein